MHWVAVIAAALVPGSDGWVGAGGGAGAGGGGGGSGKAVASLVLVDQSVYPMAACLDGSPPGFYHRPATTPSGSGKYIVYHEVSKPPAPPIIMTFHVTPRPLTRPSVSWTARASERDRIDEAPSAGAADGQSPRMCQHPAMPLQAITPAHLTRR